MGRVFLSVFFCLQQLSSESSYKMKNENSNVAGQKTKTMSYKMLQSKKVGVLLHLHVVFPHIYEYKNVDNSSFKIKYSKLQVQKLSIFNRWKTEVSILCEKPQPEGTHVPQHDPKPPVGGSLYLIECLLMGQDTSDFIKSH